jgi:hypothetical protein
MCAHFTLRPTSLVALIAVKQQQRVQRRISTSNFLVSGHPPSRACSNCV